MSDRQDTSPGTNPVPPRPASGDPAGHRPAYDPGRDPTREFSPAPVSPGPPAAGPGGEGAYGASPATSPDYSPRPVAVRRADVVGGLLLLLAGAAAAVSLLLPWVADDDATGMDLVRRGFDDLGIGVGEVIDTGLWQPLTAVLGGGVLLVLGVLVFLPARRHRFLGLLALLVSAVVAVAVLVPLMEADWDVGIFDLGFWFAVAVAVLGLLGALKALFTGRTYRRHDATAAY